MSARDDYPTRVVGYYPSWADDYEPADVPYDKLTHLNFAFLEPESDGTVTLGDPSDDDLLRELATYGENTVLELSISAGQYSGGFSEAAATAEKRKRFARTAVDHVEEYGFDGLDLDWEYPDGTFRADDPHNFTLLVEECRKELDERVGTWTQLSTTGSPNPEVIDGAYEVDALDDHLDHVNVMTYDYHGEWSTTNFNVPLFSPPEEPDSPRDWNASYTMEYWADKPIAKDKLVMGVPFYGWSFSGVEPTNQGLFQSFESVTSETYYNVRENIESQSDYEYHWHHDAKVPWLYSAAENTFISYDDAASISKKCAYANENDFGGVMCWALSQDHSNTLITEMHEVTHGSQTNPDDH